MNAAVVMALQLLRAGPETTECVAFHHHIMPLALDTSKSISDNVRYASSLGFGSTDISKPFQWAKDNGYVSLIEHAD